MEMEHIERIEEAALNAWPAPRQLLYDGWLLRFTGGPSKRVNSVNVRYRGSLPYEEKIRFSEKVYDRVGLPVIFRLPEPFTSPGLHAALESAGYFDFDPTFVLGRELTLPETLTGDLTVRQLDPAAWISLRAALMGVPAADLAIHRQILDVIVPQKVLIGLFKADMPVACGMGVLEGGLLGYFSIYTGKVQRRRGYGRAVMSALSKWGSENGANYGYLQVEGDNTPGIAMYKALGFEQCYSYWYMKKGLYS